MAMCDTCKNNRNHLEKDCEFAPGSCTCQHRTEAQEKVEREPNLQWVYPVTQDPGPYLNGGVLPSNLPTDMPLGPIAGEMDKVYYRETEASLSGAFMPLRKKKRRWLRGR